MHKDSKQSISKLFHPIIKRTPQMPESLEKTLEKFPEKFKEQFGEDDFSKITSLVATFENGNVPDDFGHFPSLAKTSEYDREYHLESYIKYMGLTLYWYGEQKIDVAWLYYSQAQYHLGCYDSWELVKDHLAYQDVEQHHRANGGKAKNRGATQPLMDALIAVIVDKTLAPDGWKNKKHLFKAAEPVLNEIYNNKMHKNLPKHENLQENVLRWLRVHNEIASLYMQHSAPDNFDGYPRNYSPALSKPVQAC